MQTSEVKRYKLVQLEAVRGIASVIVVFHHFALAFLPTLKADRASDYFVSPWRWVINGEGAVGLFFVLSGFVLTRRYFETPPRISEVSIAAAKRFPRLFVPAAASILLGYFILAFGGRAYVEAAQQSNSWWLAEFGGSAVHAGFVPTLSSALEQCFSIFFVKPEILYSSNLWTMRPELFGSLCCFAYVAVAVIWFRRHQSIAAITILAIAFAAWKLLPDVPWLVPFIIGTLIAQYYRYERFTIAGKAGLVLIVIGLALWGSPRYLLSCAGAALIIMTALACPAIAARLSGRFGSFLGRLSFPLYLVHALVICSVGSMAYLWIGSLGGGRVAAIAVAAAATAAFSWLASIPFIMLEGWWVPTLNRWAKSVAGWLARRTGRTAPASAASG